jgi:Cupin domain
MNPLSIKRGVRVHRKGSWVHQMSSHLARGSLSVRVHPVAIHATEAPARTKPSNYPEPFASRMAGREKRPLGDLFGLTNFGVNLTRLAPNAVSALRHAHSKQDEFVYIVQGRPTLRTDEGLTQRCPGMCAGFNPHFAGPYGGVRIFCG